MAPMDLDARQTWDRGSMNDENRSETPPEVNQSLKAVLFVCMANICRSPALAACLKHLAGKQGLGATLRVDSCGIGWIRLGERPDPRTFESAKKRGILIDHRSQQFQDSFLEEFDLILAVNQDILEQLKLRSHSPEHQSKILLATQFSSKFLGREIPDPYYMSPSGFDDVMDIVIDSCEGLLYHLFSK